MSPVSVTEVSVSSARGTARPDVGVEGAVFPSARRTITRERSASAGLDHDNETESPDRSSMVRLFTGPGGVVSGRGVGVGVGELGRGVVGEVSGVGYEMRTCRVFPGFTLTTAGVTDGLTCIPPMAAELALTRYRPGRRLFSEVEVFRLLRNPLGPVTLICASTPGGDTVTLIRPLAGAFALGIIETDGTADGLWATAT